MATEYHPLPRTTTKHQWLLTNGQIAEEPPLEASESGRRVRVMGTSKSVYAKDTDDLIRRAVERAAQDIGEHIWMRCDEPDPVVRLNDETGTPQPITAPHFVTPQQHDYRSRHSEVSWTFRHETLPISARITVKMESTKPRYGSGDYSHSSQTRLTWLSTNRHDAAETQVLAASNGDLPFAKHGTGTYSFEQQRQDFADFVRDNPPDWLRHLGTQAFGNEREAAAAIARLCRDLDAYDSIQIPDLRDPDNPQWITLGLYDTTYSREFAQGIIDFLNGAPIVDQMMSHWNAMVDLFRRTGIVVDGLEESDFHAAINGETERLNVNLKNLVAPEEGMSESHIVGFNLLTGTVTVTCSIRDQRDEDIATDYEIARIKAETMGELDAFIGFHAGYLGTKHDTRHAQAVAERTPDLGDLQ